GIHAGDVDRLSMRSLFPRFVDAERQHGSLLRAFRAQPQRPSSSDGAFRSLPGGLSQMIRALVARLPDGSIRLNATATRVAREGATRAFTVETADRERLMARSLVCASPAYATGALIQEIDTQLAGLCSEVPYTSTATVVLGFRRHDIAHALNGSGFVVPRV